MTNFKQLLVAGSVASLFAASAVSAQAEPITQGHLTNHDQLSWSGQPADFYNNIAAESDLKQVSLSPALQHAHDVLLRAEQHGFHDKTRPALVNHHQSSQVTLSAHAAQIQEFESH